MNKLFISILRKVIPNGVYGRLLFSYNILLFFFFQILLSYYITFIIHRKNCKGEHFFQERTKLLTNFNQGPFI